MKPRYVIQAFCALIFCIPFTSPLIRNTTVIVISFSNNKLNLSEVNFIISPWDIGSPPFYNWWRRLDTSDILISAGFSFLLPRLKKYCIGCIGSYLCHHNLSQQTNLERSSRKGKEGSESLALCHFLLPSSKYTVVEIKRNHSVCHIFSNKCINSWIHEF